MQCSAETEIRIESFVLWS